MTIGKTMGDTSTAMTSGFRRKRARDRPRLALVPRTSDSAVEDRPTIRLLRAASIQAEPSTRLSYQRKENPGIGKASRLPEVNEIGTMMRIGSTR